MLYAEVIESDVGTIIASFLGLKDSTLRFSTLNKACRGLYMKQWLKNLAAENAHLKEKDGRKFSLSLDIMRYAAHDLQLVQISPEGRRTLRSIADMQRLRSPTLYADLNRLNTTMYTFFERAPKATSDGCLDYLVGCLEVNAPEHMENMTMEDVNREVVHFKASRVFDTFTVLCDRADGTVLVGSDGVTVYLALGLAQSIGDVLPKSSGSMPPWTSRVPRLHRPLLGYEVTLTLLNWGGMVVYDGLLITQGIKVTKSQMRSAIKAYTQAVDRGTLITSLELKGKPFVPKNQRASVRAAAPSSGAKPAIEQIPEKKQARARDLIASIRLAATVGGPSAAMNMYAAGGAMPEMWVCRRHGYTVQENPGFYATLITTTGGAVLMGEKFESLEPTVMELLEVLNKGVQVRRMKPPAFCVDSESAVEPLRELLKPTGVHVEFYAPPSKEEEMQHQFTNPYLSSAERNQPYRKQDSMGCGLCGAPQGVNGKPLQKCSKCKVMPYCCREHQVQDWKFHKKVCGKM